jgi:hypothetical protein
MFLLYLFESVEILLDQRVPIIIYYTILWEDMVHIAGDSETLNGSKMLVKMLV